MTPLRLQRAVTCLRRGGVLAYPTEAVWGLGCDPFDHAAVAAILALKQRPQAKGLILVASSIAQFAPYLQGLSPQQYQQLARSWPAAITWLVPDNGYAPLAVRGDHGSVALRVSAHPLVQQLCQAWGGPIVSTSANRAGRPALRNEWQVRREFGRGIDCYLPGPLGGASAPSKIIDLQTGRVLRG